MLCKLINKIKCTDVCSFGLPDDSQDTCRSSAVLLMQKLPLVPPFPNPPFSWEQDLSRVHSFLQASNAFLTGRGKHLPLCGVGSSRIQPHLHMFFFPLLLSFLFSFLPSFSSSFSERQCGKEERLVFVSRL